MCLLGLLSFNDIKAKKVSKSIRVEGRWPYEWWQVVHNVIKNPKL
jgi:hypothetical protein